jgi:hypothetical protein
MPSDTCTATLADLDTTLRCDLPADHTASAALEPEGSPHRDSTVLDVVTGTPRMWWS